MVDRNGERVTVGDLLARYPTVPFGSSGAAIPTATWMNMGRRMEHCDYIPDPGDSGRVLNPDEHGRMAWALGNLVVLYGAERLALDTLPDDLREETIARQGILSAGRDLSVG
ncbi:MAG: hypothetical protein WBP26_01345 [Candidatus Saccharimonadales bacterium]